jgi:hypothetical protein
MLRLELGLMGGFCAGKEKKSIHQDEDPNLNQLISYPSLETPPVSSDKFNSSEAISTLLDFDGSSAITIASWMPSRIHDVLLLQARNRRCQTFFDYSRCCCYFTFLRGTWRSDVFRHALKSLYFVLKALN